MNFILSSDDNYAQHMGVAIYSILDHNREEEVVNIFVVDNDIKDENRQKLRQLEQQFLNAHFHFIAFGKWRDSLQLDMAWNISISSYARLFVASMLPESIERVVYMDCDMVVTSSLQELWHTDMQGSVIAAVQDDMPTRFKSAVGLASAEPYFNAGLLLIDLKKWREQNCERTCLDFIKEHEGRVIHHDQGVLNGVFRGKWHRLPLQANIMTIHYIFTLRQIMKYFRDESPFYTEQEITEAKRQPWILHFTPSFTSRPWVGNCKHPLKSLYWAALSHTPWRGTKPQKDHDKWYVILINWRYRVLPY